MTLQPPKWWGTQKIDPIEINFMVEFDSVEVASEFANYFLETGNTSANFSEMFWHPGESHVFVEIACEQIENRTVSKITEGRAMVRDMLKEFHEHQKGNNENRNSP